MWIQMCDTAFAIMRLLSPQSVQNDILKGHNLPVISFWEIDEVIVTVQAYA